MTAPPPVAAFVVFAFLAFAATVTILAFEWWGVLFVAVALTFCVATICIDRSELP